MFPHRSLACLLLLGLLACDDFEGGDAPQFSGFTATVVGESQIALSWAPATDDFLDSEELVYLIWVSEPGGMIDSEADPQFITGEGALSYNLIGLTASSTYEILVRARERGSSGTPSENSATQTITTNASGQGRYQREEVFSLTDEPNALINGTVLSSSRDSLGLVYDRRIQWLTRSSTGEFEFLDQEVETDADILSAHLVRMRTGTLYDDLILLTSNGLSYYRNRQVNTGDVFEDPITLPNSSPRAGTLDFTFNEEDGGYITFIDFGGGIVTFSFDTDDDVFVLQGSFPLGDPNAVVHLAFVNDFGQSEALPDYVVFGTNGLGFVLDDETDPFVFGTFEDVQEDDSPLSGSELDFFVYQGDADTQVDAYVFQRNESDDDTRGWGFQGNTEGFEDLVEHDFTAAFYAEPLFADFNNDGTPDLSVSQTSSNNVVVSSGPFPTYSAVAGRFGGEGMTVRHHFANLDSTAALDLIIIGEAADGIRLTILLANP